MNTGNTKEKYFENISCPVCGSNHGKSFIKVTYGQLKQKPSLDYSIVGINGDTEINVDECLTCGFVFVNPRIKAEYQHLIYNESKQNMYKRKQHLQQVDENFYSKTKTARLAHAHILLKVLVHIDRSRSLILFDYGCGFGYSMSSAKEFGITAYGVDIDQKRLALCEAQGLNVCTPDEFEEKFKDVKADIILWQNNIEHVVDLSQSASFIRDRSKQGAVLYVNGLTPTMIRTEQRRGSFIKAHFVEHLNYFPIKTLHRFMADYGFKPLNRPKYSQSQGKTVFIKDIVKSLFNTPALESITYRLRSNFGRLYRYGG